MSAGTLASLIKLSVGEAGWRAPALLGRYLRLTWLNRTSAGRAIAKVPSALKSTAATQPEGRRAARGDVVVPVYNNYDDTRGLLASLREEAPAIGRIILVHDASTDRRLAPLLRSFAADVPNAVLLENDMNLGFVKTCNRGLAAARNDVVILNTDIELPRRALARLFKVLESDAAVATVTPFSNAAYAVGFPRLLHYNERPFGATTAEIDAAFQELGGLEPIDLPRGVGFCMGISRRALDDVGLFSTIYGTGYGEEADFCLKARRAGYRNVVAPDVFVFHKGGESFGSSWQEKARAGQMRLLHHHPEYPSLMASYLADNEARAVCFAALVRLATARGGGPPGLEWSQRGGEIASDLTFRTETYRFLFAGRDAASAACELAGIRPGV